MKAKQTTQKTQGAVRRPRRRAAGPFALLVALLLAAIPAASLRAADPVVSQAVGVTNAIVDEFGVLLPGTDPGAPAYGIPAVEGDLVQFLHATDNVIYPPDTNGVPDPRNVVLMTTRIGRGVSPVYPVSGRFGANVAPRPGGNSRIFARVFNAPSLEEASFYGDSQIFLVRSWKNEPFLLHLQATTLPLDPNDDDGDGLNNSWEKSYGSDPHQVDSDGDGFSDAEEALAKTDLLDAESMLVIVTVRPEGQDDAHLAWDSQEGVMYRVEYTADALGENPVYTIIATLEGRRGQTEFIVEHGLADACGSFRVWAVR